MYPEYYDVVQYPIDLGRITAKSQRGDYTVKAFRANLKGSDRGPSQAKLLEHSKEFIDDVALMVNNTYKFCAERFPVLCADADRLKALAEVCARHLIVLNFRWHNYLDILYTPLLLTCMIYIFFQAIVLKESQADIDDATGRVARCPSALKEKTAVATVNPARA